MTDASLSEALKEAYASADSEIIILHTLELRHPAFVDENGLPTAIRVVRDNVNHICRLEESAPLNAGQDVEFVAWLLIWSFLRWKPFLFLKLR